MKKKGALVFVLHAHLPFIRHPEHEFFLEEDWLFEALTETYIPLLLAFERLQAAGIPPNVGISFSPPLCAMMEDDVLKSRYRRYLGRLVELSGKEVERNRSNPLLLKSARMYLKHFETCLKLTAQYNGDLLEPFRRLQNAGAIEIVTCTATHGMLPLMIHPEAIRTQIAVAAQEYQRRFQRPPAGIWLGECAYDHRVDKYLAQEGFKYFFMDQHGLTYARPQPRYGAHAPVRTPHGVYAFGRDLETAKQVWSAIEGYPGDPSYREFYRDLGYDADHEYIRPYLHPDGIRRNTGIKYHRVTGKVDLKAKEYYDPDIALETAKRHAEHFINQRMAQMDRLGSEGKSRPVIVSTYDAELYGHWWFEGPAFIEHMIRAAAASHSTVEMRTPSAILRETKSSETVQPEISSWGDKGYFEVWLNQSNDWIYPHLHAVTERMIELANRFGTKAAPNAHPVVKRALNQCAREVLLAQSSDWPFMMTVGSHIPYARERVRVHTLNFLKLYDQIQNNRVEERFLQETESKNNIFQNIDYRVFASPSSGVASNNP